MCNGLTHPVCRVSHSDEDIHADADMVTYAVRIREVHGVGRVDVTNEFFGIYLIFKLHFAEV